MFSKFNKYITYFFKRSDLITLFFIGLVVRIALLSASVSQLGVEGIIGLSSDCKYYISMAEGVITNTDSAYIEKGFFTFGPGFAYFIAYFKILIYNSTLGYLIFQTIISSLIPILIYKLSRMLELNYWPSLLAGYLFCFSYTAISLSSMILSETIFVFLFVLSLITFLKALDSKNILLFITAGILFGYASLIKPIGQFWFVPMVLLAFIFGYLKNSSFKFIEQIKLLKLPLITAVICIGVISIWLVRNKIEHDIYTLSSASAGGPVNVAAFAMEKQTGTYYRDIKAEWFQAYREKINVEVLSQEDIYYCSKEKTSEFIKEYPLDFFKGYLTLTWDNVNAVNFLPRLLLPKYKGMIVYYDNVYRQKKLQYVSFIVACLGLLILLFKKKYKAFWCLLFIYFYFAALIGFTRFQGTRLFFPGQIAGTILMATTCSFLLYQLYLLGKKAIDLIKKSIN